MSAQFEKGQIAASFSRAAVSYDAVAELQRQIGHALLARLPELTPAVVLDLGCGTGYFGPLLEQRLAPEHLISLDLAQGMLRYARESRPTRNSVDLIFSSLAIQWCENLPALFAEVARVLRPGGRFVFSTLGPNTLQELRKAWSGVDQYQHVNRFIGLETLRQQCSLGLQLAALDEEERLLLYPEVRGLTNELKGIGAHNISAGRPTSLTGKARILAFKQAYEAFRRADGMLPATYQVFYGEVMKEGSCG